MFCCYICDIFKLKENWLTNYEFGQNNKYVWQCDLLSNTIGICNKLHSKKNNKTIVINIIKSFTPIELEIINNLDNIQYYLSNQSKEKFGQYKAYSSYLSKQIEKYGKEWIKWTTHSNFVDEYQMMVENLPHMLDYPFEIKLVESKDMYMFKFGPGLPNIVHI